MIRNLTALIVTILIVLTASTLPAETAEHRVITADNFPVAQPILMASDDGMHLYSVTGHWDNPGWGYALHVSSDNGTTWDTTYENYQGQEIMPFDAVFYGNAVYVARIDQWASGTTTNYELIIQRFDIDGVRDTSFGTTGYLSISGQTTSTIADVSLIAGYDALEVFWIEDNTLRHSYCLLPTGTGLTHSNIGSTVAYGSLDAVAMTGTNAHFFAAFKGSGNKLVGWKWKFNEGAGVVNITPDEDLYPEWETVTVSAYGTRVEVVVSSPWDSNPTEVYAMTSTDECLNWDQQTIALGWDGVGIHMQSASVVIGPDQSVVTLMIKDDNASTEEWAYLERQHGGNWSPAPIVFTPSTDFIGTPMGMSWSPEGGFRAAYYSNNPLSSIVYLVRMPQLMRTGFEEGDFSQWSSVVGN